MLFSKNTFGSRVFSIVEAVKILIKTKSSCFIPISSENRVFDVISEDRLFEVLPENRFIECPSVCSEDRTFIVQGKCVVH